MAWYRRLTWLFYLRILVLGMGRFQAAVAFVAWVRTPYVLPPGRNAAYLFVDSARACRGAGGQIRIPDGRAD